MPDADTVHCPVCDEIAVLILKMRDLIICGVCGASLVLQDGEPRQAVRSDMEWCSDIDLSKLRRARASLARPERKQR